MGGIGNGVENGKVKEVYLKVLRGGEVVKGERGIRKVSVEVRRIELG